MNRVARASGDEVEGLDEEFLFHLNRGTDLLQRGDAEPARVSLERALELRPKDAKALGLLGQACYRLSRFEEAARHWQRLVDDNPVEPAARVNLGLACLKARRHLDAVKQLEIAIDLNPDHRKAMGYLGLALLESGNLTRARDWFRKAGSDAMVARCDELIASRAAAPSSVSEAVAASEPLASAGTETEAPPAPEPLNTAPTAAPVYRAPAPEGSVLAAWAAARLVTPPPGETFSAVDGTLTVTVHGETCVRLDGLFATKGKLDMIPEVKRFRGRATGKPFGEGARRMHRITGQGVLLYRTAGRRFTALDLGADAAYLREEALFGFEEGLAFENGRVPSSISAELNLVHLRGRGRFLLATVGDPVAVDVGPDAPLRVPLATLVGWMGALTPRVCALLESHEGLPVAAVELTGEGRVLADPAAAIGSGG